MFVGNYSYVNPYIFAGSSIIISLLIVLMIYNLRKNTFKSNFFLVFAVLSLGFANILQLLFSVDLSSSGLPGFIIELFPYSLAILSSLLVMFFLLLFFRTFESEIIMNKLEMILSGFLLVIFSSMFSTILLISAFFSTGPQFGPAPTDSTATSTSATISQGTNQVTPQAGNIGFIQQFYGLIIVFSIILTIVFFISLIWTFRNINKNIESKATKTITKMFQGSIIPILVGSMVALTLNITIGTFISAIGFIIMAVLNFKYGNFILQGEILQHMVILDSEGLPIYGYKFNMNDIDNEDDINDREILFSGALTAVSSLITEFTGNTSQEVREITLNGLIIMVSSIKVQENNYSVVLLTKKSTVFYRDSLKKFTKNIPMIIEQNMQRNYGFTVEQVKNTNMLLESSFGRTY